MSLPRFKYTALAHGQNQIRLLKLLDSGSHDAPISCCLQVQDFDRLLEYEALSYVWGEEPASLPILLDGLHFEVRPNLYRALHRLKHQSRPRVLWIDAICINQADQEEKESQIPLMRDIYRRASQVVVWLGEADRIAQAAFKYLQKIICALTNGTDEDFQARAKIQNIFDIDSYDALVALLERDWFHRRWIVQEICLARTAVMICGQLSLLYDDFHHAVLAIVDTEGKRPPEDRRQQPARSANFDPLELISYYRNLNPEPCSIREQLSLLRILERIRNNRVHLAQDCIFAVLGICGEDEANQNIVEYNLSPPRVFETAVLSHGRIYQNLEFLGACNYQSSLSQSTDATTWATLRRPEHPSWVPNWNVSHAVRRLGPDGKIVDGSYKGIFNASQGLPMRTLNSRIEKDSTGIKANVILIDRVGSIDEYYQGGEHAQQFLYASSQIYQEYFRFWYQTPLQDTSYGTQEERTNAFIRTLTLGGKSGEIILDFETLKAKFQSFFQNAEFFGDLSRNGFRCSDRSIDNERSMSTHILKYFRAVRTLEGRMALTRFGCWEGDFICVVGGCSTPLLLRGPVGRDEHFIVRGEVYLDGFMHGEAIEHAKRRGLGVQCWTLV